MRIIKKKQTAIKMGIKSSKWLSKRSLFEVLLPIVCGKKTLPRYKNSVKADSNTPHNPGN